MIRLNKQYHNVLIKNPHIQSFAAALLLSHKYKIKKRRIPYKVRVWLTFRNKYLKRQKKKNKVLRCQYCGIYPLESNYNNPNSNRTRATIDHIYPLGKGGKRYDESNLCVACVKCNQKKADKV